MSDLHERKEDTGWAPLPFNYCPLSPYAPPALFWDKRELWNWIAEHILTNKATLLLAANRGGGTGTVTATTQPCQGLISSLTVGKKTNLSGLNPTCSGADEWPGYRCTAWLVVVLCSKTLCTIWSFNWCLEIKVDLFRFPSCEKSGLLHEVNWFLPLPKGSVCTI